MSARPWLERYPKGVPHDVDPDLFASLPDLLQTSIDKFGPNQAYECMGKALTYSQVGQLSTQFAAYLQNDLGLKKGDRIAIQMPNLLQYPVALLGALKAGLVVVNTNPLYTPREMEHQFKDSGAVAVVILANFAANLQKIIGNTQIKHVIVTQIGDLLGGFKKTLVNFVVKKVKKMVPPYSIPGAIKFNDALNKGHGLSLSQPDIDRNDPAFLQYTGGTTGVSKGAILTHRNMQANMEQMVGWMRPLLEEGKETIITALPLYHIFALTVNCLAMIRMGNKSILITNPRDMDGFMKELAKHPFSIITGVNTLFNGMLNQPKFATLDFSHLKISIGGGMAVQKAVTEKWQKATNSPLVEGYGLTETAPLVTCNPLDGTDRVGTIGLPVPSTEVRFCDDDGKDVAKDEPGEICVRGPQVMAGYWQRPDETAKVMLDDWFRTGDMGMIDDDGFVRIVDRKKEMINVSGFNVYPNEVENTVASHPKVLEVGAIGVPDERSTEVVKVFVVKKDPSLTAEELRAYCKEHLTGYKVPKYVAFLDELPKSNVGKILRRILKENDPQAMGKPVEATEEGK